MTNSMHLSRNMRIREYKGMLQSVKAKMLKIMTSNVVTGLHTNEVEMKR